MNEPPSNRFENQEIAPVQFKVIYTQTPKGYRVYRQEVGVEGTEDELLFTLSKYQSQNYYQSLLNCLSVAKTHKIVGCYDSASIKVMTYQCIPVKDIE